MSQFQDEIGLWNEMGTVTPVHNQWVKFPIAAQYTNGTFRATFFGDIQGSNSYVWFRSEYLLDNIPEQAQQAIRVYPSPDQKIIQYPIPQPLILRNVFIRSISVRKRHRWKRQIGFTPDSQWSMRLDELW